MGLATGMCQKLNQHQMSRRPMAIRNQTWPLQMMPLAKVKNRKINALRPDINIIDRDASRVQRQLHLYTFNTYNTFIY